MNGLFGWKTLNGKSINFDPYLSYVQTSWIGLNVYLCNKFREGEEVGGRNRIAQFLLFSLHFKKNKFIFIWLHWVLVATCEIFSCSMQTLSCSMWESRSLIRDRTQPPYTGRTESEPLDHWGSPGIKYLNVKNIIEALGLKKL